MDENWDDDAPFVAPTSSADPSFADEGRSYGKGRGYAPMNNNDDAARVGSRNGNYKSNNFGENKDDWNDNENKSGGGGGDWQNGSGGGWQNGSGGDRRGRGGNSRGYGRENRSRDDGGNSWGNNDRFNGCGDNDDDGGSRSSRGGRGGRRGGYNNRNEDGGGWENDRGGNGGGGWGNDNGDGDSNFKSSYRGGRGGGRGGYKNRNEDGGDWGNDKGGSGGDDWGNDRGGSGGGGGDWGNDNGDGDSNFKSRHGGGRGGGRGGGYGGRGRSDDDAGNQDNENKDEEGASSKPAPVTYIPPEFSTDDSEIYKGLDTGINFSKYDNIPVKATGENVPAAIGEFDKMGLRSLVYENLMKSGYTKATPVQKHAIPIIMAGRDLMSCAQTGSGKTAAFLVPIINTLLEQPTELKIMGGGCEPHCVIVSPTRELASQIWQQALKFSKGSIIKCAVAYGGVSPVYQGRQIANGCHILVATPGRLIDCVDRRRVGFGSLRYLVLDEADRMLEMGFRDSVQKIMDHETMSPKDTGRQTLMFSATFPEGVQKIAGNYLENYVFLAVGFVGGACTDVEQHFFNVPKFEKRSKIRELLGRDDVKNMPKTLVFVERKKTADFLAAYLSTNDFPTTSMHGDRTQEQREEALRDFQRGKMPILVATAVAARGLDIKNVAHVVNFDMPQDIDEYVHRIGRTGRLGNRGRATSFYDPSTDAAIVNDLVKILRQAEQEVPDWLDANDDRSYAPNRGEKFGGRDVRKFDEDVTYGDSPSNAAFDPEPEEEW